jgi:hypothetical protein
MFPQGNHGSHQEVVHLHRRSQNVSSPFKFISSINTRLILASFQINSGANAMTLDTRRFEGNRIGFIGILEFQIFQDKDRSDPILN